MPKVSVIIPVYGVEKYIERCAVSLFEQTLDDIEYIFINDCTKDKSIDVLKRVLSKYPNRQHQTKIVSMPQNSGQAAVRKYGVSLSSGDYIAHCDSDDWVDINMYELLYTKAKDKDIDIVFCDYYNSDGYNNELVKRDINISTNYEVIRSISKSATWNLWSSIVRRDVYENPMIYPQHNNGEDFALMFQLIYFAGSFYRINIPLYYYFFNSVSVTNLQNEDSYVYRYRQLFYNTELVINFLRDKNEINKFKELIIAYKLYCRTKISPLTGQIKYRILWQSIYPELKFDDVLFNTILPIKTKLHYISVIFKVYHIIYDKLKKY